MINGLQSKIEPADPILVQLVADLVAMEKDRDRWRIAMKSVVPRVRANFSAAPEDPLECAEEIRQGLDASRRQCERMSKDYRKLRRLELVLENAKKALHMMRDVGEPPELRALARDILLQIQEQLQKP